MAECNERHCVKGHFRRDTFSLTHQEKFTHQNKVSLLFFSATRELAEPVPSAAFFLPVAAVLVFSTGTTRCAESKKASFLPTCVTLAMKSHSKNSSSSKTRKKASFR